MSVHFHTRGWTMVLGSLVMSFASEFHSASFHSPWRFFSSSSRSNCWMVLLILLAPVCRLTEPALVVFAVGQKKTESECPALLPVLPSQTPPPVRIALSDGT